MVKLKTPLFSLGAHGTISDSLTFQSNSKRKFVREKPRLPYSLTLPQQYQRWLYHDYSYLWTQQTEAVKREYAAAGVRFHLTGYQYWMKYHLSNLPDIDCMYRLDSLSGALATDYSPNSLDLAVIGASLVSGIIGDQAHFDGINDTLWRARAAPFDFTDEMTLECFFTPLKFSSLQRIVSYVTPGNPRYYLYIDAANRLFWWVNDGLGGGGNIISASAYPTTQVLHLLATLTNTRMEFYINGLPEIPLVTPVVNFAPLSVFRVSAHSVPASGFLGGRVDHLVKYNRVLDATEALTHSRRRYSL